MEIEPTDGTGHSTDGGTRERPVTQVQVRRPQSTEPPGTEAENEGWGMQVLPKQSAVALGVRFSGPDPTRWAITKPARSKIRI